MTFSIFRGPFLLCLLLLARHSTADDGRYVVTNDIASAGKYVNVTSELQAIIDQCSEAGGGTVFLPPGEYLIGTIVLKDNTFLELSAGATLYGSTNIEDYEEVGSSGLSALICSVEATNVGVCGEGTINGQGDVFWRGKKRPYTRPDRLVLFLQSQDVKVRDVTITNSPNWCVDIRECDRVWVEGVSIINDRESPNSDGIDPVSSSNVLISNCYIDTGDDAICPKTRGDRPLENLVVTNCILRSDDSAIKLGTRSDSDIRNVLFSNIVIRDTQYGIALFAKDGGSFENVRFQGIDVETTRAQKPESLNSRETYPLLIDIEKRHGDSKMSHVQGVVFSDITIDSLEGTCLFLGQPDSKLRDILLSDIAFTLHHRNPLEDNRKPRGTKSLRDKASNDFSSKAASFVFAHVENLHISGLRYTDVSKGAQHERRVLWGRDLHDVTVRELSSRHTEPNRKMPLLRFEESSRVEIAACSPGPSATPFAEVDESTQSIVLDGNNCSNVASVLRTDGASDEEQALLHHNLPPQGTGEGK